MIFFRLKTMQTKNIHRSDENDLSLIHICINIVVFLNLTLVSLSRLMLLVRFMNWVSLTEQNSFYLSTEQSTRSPAFTTMEKQGI